MRDQVVMSPNNGQLIVAIPLYRRHVLNDSNIGPFLISIEGEKPIAYAIDCGPEFDRLQFFNAEWVEKNLEFLGDL